MKSEEVRVHLDKNDTLLISGERIPSDHASDVKYLTKEIKYGRFERVLHVPKGTMVGPFSFDLFILLSCGDLRSFPVDEYHIGSYE